MTHEPTEKSRKFVKDAAAAQCSKEFIPKELNINKRTLDKYYSQELEGGFNYLVMKAVSRLETAAEDPKNKEGIAASIYIMKNRWVSADAQFRADELKSEIKDLGALIKQSRERSDFDEES